MSTHEPIPSPGAAGAYEPVSPAEKLEEDAAVGVAAALRAVKVATIVLIGLLVCPPLAVLVFVVVAPALVIAAGIGLVAAVVWTPYVLVQHITGYGGGHLHLLAHRLRHAGRALIDLAPHRIAADSRRLHSGR
jgi:hypothetical protein